MSTFHRRTWPLALLAIAVVGVFAAGLDDYLSFEALREHRRGLQEIVAAHPVLAPLGFAAIYAAAVALSVPGAIWLTLAGGFLFGPWLGGAIVVIAATIGACGIFLIARTALAEPLRERAGPWIAKLRKGFNEGAFSYLLILRLVPVVPFWLLNIVPGLLGMRLPAFAAATLIGILPATFVYAGIGNGLGAVFDAGTQPDLSIVMQPQLVLPLVGLGVLALIPLVRRRWKGRSAAQISS